MLQTVASLLCLPLSITWEVICWTVKVLNLYSVLPQNRHLGYSLSQPTECFLSRSGTEIVLRSSSWSVSCSGAVVWCFCMLSSCKPLSCIISSTQNLKWTKQILIELYFPQFRHLRQMTWVPTSTDVRLTLGLTWQLRRGRRFLLKTNRPPLLWPPSFVPYTPPVRIRINGGERIPSGKNASWRPDPRIR